MRKITVGDLMHAYGGLGDVDYNVRLHLVLDHKIDGDILKKALKSTSKRYPYLCVRILKNEKECYLEDNKEEVCLFNTSNQIRLNAPESNYHIWAVCYEDDNLYFDFFHGICDGTGMYFVLTTLLYYYLSEKFGPISKEGVRTLEDPIDEAEYTDPMDALPQIDLSKIPASSIKRTPAFCLLEDAKMTLLEKPINRDLMISEKDLLRFTSQNDASPGTLISLLLARAVDKVNPKREKDIISGYVINGRPMLGAPKSHHNCVTTCSFKFSDKIKNMPIDRQCTSYRGMTFLQSDADAVRKLLTFSASKCREALEQPSFEAKKEAYTNIILSGSQFFTFIVSYVGQWKHKEIGAHIKEFWTHIPDTKRCVVELAAVNGQIFVSMLQGFKEDVYFKAFLKELDDNNISYRVKAAKENDVAVFVKP